MLGELEEDGRIVVFDMEAGAGTLLRMEKDAADVVLVVAEPSAKSIEVARRMADIGDERARVIVLANKIRDDVELEAVRDVLGRHEVVVIPHDAGIERAERDGRAPIDVDADGPGVAALRSLAERLVRDGR